MKVGIVGDFRSEDPSHIATNHALMHSSAKLGVSIEYEWIPTAAINKKWKSSRKLIKVSG